MKSQKMKEYKRTESKPAENQAVCPVCGEVLVQEKCKVVCRSRICVYRIIYNCSEF